MPPNFTTLLAGQLTKAGNRPCHEATNSMVVTPGHAYIAPGDYHMRTTRKGTEVQIALDQSPQVNYLPPGGGPDV